MIRTTHTAANQVISIPRESGDDPLEFTFNEPDDPYSPRERG